MTTTHFITKTPDPFVSIGIIAYNEEASIGVAINSLLDQSVFEWLHINNNLCEIVCITNGCTDRTAEVATQSLTTGTKNHPHSIVTHFKTEDIKEKGKNNALNLYYRTASNQNAKYHILMDADIIIDHKDTILNLILALDNAPDAYVSVDTPIKDIQRKDSKSLIDKISLATSRSTQAMSAQITGQLYCIRGVTAKNIYFPKGLLMDDGYIKVMICTDYLTTPSNPHRVVRAENATHIFEAYTSIKEILNNQKRQMIGQTITHVLCDKYLPSLSATEKSCMAKTLAQKDVEDPGWVYKLIDKHILEIGSFTKIYPEAITHRLKRLRVLKGLDRMLYLPVAIIGTIVNTVSSYRAYKSMKEGVLSYWPSKRQNLPD